MGTNNPIRVVETRFRPLSYPLPRLRRRRPRLFEEWLALRDWGKLPEQERLVPGYQLRAAREAAGLTQAQLADRLECSQQAVSQAERWEANPTVELVRRWAEATESEVKLTLKPGNAK